MSGENFPMLIAVLAMALVYVVVRTLSGAGRTTYEDRKAVQDLVQAVERIEQRLDALEAQLLAREPGEKLE